jgi:hypothetical protein
MRYRKIRHSVRRLNFAFARYMLMMRLRLVIADLLSKLHLSFRSEARGFHTAGG